MFINRLATGTVSWPFTNHLNRNRLPATLTGRLADILHALIST